MTKLGKLVLGIAVVVVLCLTFFAGRVSAPAEVGIGVPGTRTGIEEYVPYIKYNDGYYSLLGITSTAIITGDDLVSVDDITAGDDLVVTDDATVSGGSLNVTTSNSATSTIAAGCWQLTATSTASPLKAVPAAISTTTTTFGSATVGFPLIAVPGTCP